LEATQRDRVESLNVKKCEAEGSFTIVLSVICFDRYG